MNENENVLEQPEEQPQEEAQAEMPVTSSPDVSNEVVPEDIALETVEQIKGDRDEVTLDNGYRVRFRSLPLYAMAEAEMSIVDPLPPLTPNPDPNRAPIPNPDDPKHLEKLRQNQLKRITTQWNLMFSLGFELLDPLPEDNKWLDSLVAAEKISEQEAQSASDAQKELWFKKYIVADIYVFNKLSEMASVTQEGIAQKSAAFKSNA